MCELSNRLYKLKHPRTVWKRAPGGISEFPPDSRTKLGDYGFTTRGKMLRYPIGKTVLSPSGPGIMAYIEKPRVYAPWGSYSWLELRIPKGAVIRYGVNNGKKIIAASKVFVVRTMGKL